MKRLLLLLIPSLSLAASAGTNVTPGTWDVYSGTSRVASETTEAACIERGKAMKLAKFGCRTITTVVVTADPVPEPPVVVPPVIVPEPPKPPVVGRPGPDSTGPKGALKAISGVQTLTAGKVLENFELTGTIVVKGAGVRIRNFRIKANDKWAIHATDASVKDLLIEDGEISGAGSLAIYGRNWTARRMNIHSSGSDGVRSVGNSSLEYSWIHELGYPKAHADAVQLLEGYGFRSIGNFYDLPHDNPTWMNSAAFMIQVSKGPVGDFLSEGDWFCGGDFTIQLTGNVTNARIRNGTFCREGKGGSEYGAWSDRVPKIAVELCGNRYTDGSLIPGNKACQ
jgi:hypothetical protein